MPVLFNAKKLRSERKQHDLTQAMLAERADTSARYVRFLETSQTANPSAGLVFRLSKALQLSMGDLMMEKVKGFITIPQVTQAPSTDAETYRCPMPVTEVRRYPSFPELFTYPLCPRCTFPLEREYQRFCNNCGQALDWRMLSQATVVLAHSSNEVF